MGSEKKNIRIRVLSIVLTAVLLITCTVAFIPGKESISSFLSGFGASGDNFDVQLYWSEDPDADGWNNVESSGYTIAFPNTVLWEPGHTEIRYFKVADEGNVDFTYELDLDGPGDDYDSTDTIGDVIDVYSTTDVSDLSTAAYSYKGTLNEVILNPQILTGDMDAGSSVSCALKFTMKTTAGNEYQGQKVGFKVKANAYAEETEEEFSGTFGCVFPNYESILYRVGNSNAVAASSLFYINEEDSSSASSLMMIKAYAAETLDDSLVTFTSSTTAGTASVAITPNTTDWSQGSFRFSGTGVVNIKLLYNGVEKVSLNLEVMNGKNVTAAASATSSNIILLNDVSTGSNISVSGGYTLYGNGFTVTDARTDTSNTSGFLNMNNGTLDNVQVLGLEYETLVSSGTTNQYYSPCIRLLGTENHINNSRVSGCKYAILVEGDLEADGSVFDGGTMGNMCISSGSTTLTDCTTATSIRGGLKGMAIQIASTTAHLTLNGTFNQYNWIKYDDVPSDYQAILKDIYSDSTYAYTSGSNTYLNMGILCKAGSGNFSQTEAAAAITDNTSNSYGFIEKTVFSVTGSCYTQKSSTASASTLSLSAYSMIDQYPTAPTAVFDFTTLNYIARSDDSDKYCVPDDTTGGVKISFSSDDGSFSWNPMILTLTKYGSSVSYTVSMNGTDYTDSTIPFTASGDYEVVYTYTDTNYYHGKEAEKSSLTYTKTVSINVTVTEPSVKVSKPLFTFGSNSAKYTLISDAYYVMPDVSATTDSIGSTTISGTTVYYPIVTVGPTSSNGNTTYSSGKGYYFAPCFSAVNITDYTYGTTTVQYTYNSSSTTWPHGQSSSSGPDSSVFGYTGSVTPYARSMDSQYYGYGTNNNGLCYTANEIEKDNTASTHLVKFYYTGNDGNTYYYYIQYSFTAMTYKSSTCFAEGTMITLADGSEKPIEELTMDDEILTRNFFTGKSEAKKCAMIVDHGKETSEVINLEFSDGSVIRAVVTHGIYDYDLNDFVYINFSNCKDYIGHRFAKHFIGSWHRKVKLVDAYVTTENVHAYSIASVDNLNAYADGILTMTPPADYYNWIEKGRKLRFDTKQFNADVEKYGLYRYEEFSDYLTEEQFDAFNVAYCKIAVGKGIFTYDYILQLIENYGKFFR